MANTTKIEWCDSTFNPWAGCTRISPACDHCYAAVSTAVKNMGAVWGAGNPRKRTSENYWKQPLRWNRADFNECGDCGWRGEIDTLEDDTCPNCGKHERLEAARRRVFCASLADVFDNEVDPQWRADLFHLIQNTPNLDWLLLTKRIGNAEKMIAEAMREQDIGHAPAFTTWPWPNVWLGATIANQAEADRDIPKLLATPAEVRFLSMEPLLGLVDLTRICDRSGTRGLWINCIEAREDNPAHPDLVAHLGQDYPYSRIDWVIAGGESGHSARPMHPDWVRSLRDQCAEAGVPFLFKQWGEWRPALADEEQRHTFPTDKRVDIGCGRSLPFVVAVARVGKKAAGRLLDGFEHNGVPRAQ